jgi:hypothetical protein
MRRRSLAVATILALVLTLLALIAPDAAARDRTELFWPSSRASRRFRARATRTATARPTSPWSTTGRAG